MNCITPSFQGLKERDTEREREIGCQARYPASVPSVVPGVTTVTKPYHLIRSSLCVEGIKLK